MRDRKISILLSVSFLLLLASFLILCTWLYNYYTKDKPISKASTKTIPIRSEETRDSLLKIYTSTIRDLENQLGTTYTRSDSMETRLSLKLDDYYRLKDELAVLLKNPQSNDDFKTAKQKVAELQRKMEELRNVSMAVEAENARLYKLLAQINKDRDRDRDSEPQTVQYVETSNSGNRQPQVDKNRISPFSSVELSLAAIKDDSDDQDVFSTQRKIIGSFALTHTLDMHHSDVMIIITQPDGQVLQKSAWESGSFQSDNGKKIYSLKMSVNYTRGEAKKLTFAIVTERFVRGNYTMQLYNNGVLIGRLTRTLS